MKSKWVLFCLPLVLATGLTLASPEDLWLHVYVQEGGDQGEGDEGLLHGRGSERDLRWRRILGAGPGSRGRDCESLS